MTTTGINKANQDKFSTIDIQISECTTLWRDFKSAYINDFKFIHRNYLKFIRNTDLKLIKRNNIKFNSSCEIE